LLFWYFEKKKLNIKRIVDFDSFLKKLKMEKLLIWFFEKKTQNQRFINFGFLGKKKLKIKKIADFDSLKKKNSKSMNH